jgi:hypothetical protein
MRMATSDTTHDSWLEELIDGTTDRLEIEAGRRFKAADYKHWHSGAGEKVLVVQQRPLIYVNRIASGSSDGIEVQYTGSAIRATIQVYEAGVRIASTAASGTVTAANHTFATSASMSTLAATLDAVSDWTATAKNDAPSDDMHLMGGQDAMTPNTVMLTWPDTDDTNYRLDRDTGLIVFGSVSGGWPDGSPHVNRGWQNVLVDYRAGYETIPDDLALLAAEVVAEAFQRSEHDRSVTSDGIGGYSSSLRDPIQVSESQRDRLMRWSNVQVGGLAVA